jgi:hypothetical protein
VLACITARFRPIQSIAGEATHSAGDMRTAQQTIFHDTTRPSRIVLAGDSGYARTSLSPSKAKWSFNDYHACSH